MSASLGSLSLHDIDISMVGSISPALSEEKDELKAVFRSNSGFSVGGANGVGASGESGGGAGGGRGGASGSGSGGDSGGGGSDGGGGIEGTSHSSKEIQAMEKRVSKLFGLKSEDVLVAWYKAHTHGMAMNVAGTLYVSLEHVCFSARSFGCPIKHIIRLTDVTAVEGTEKKLRIRTAKTKLSFSLRGSALEDLIVLLKRVWRTRLAKEKQGSHERSFGERSVMALNEVPIGRPFAPGIAAEDSSTDDLSRRDWNAILAGATSHTYSEGEVIIRNGSDERYALYQIHSGTCRVVKHASPTSTVIDDSCVEIARLGPGDTFGEVSFLTRSASCASVVAAESVEVHCIDGEFLNVLFLRQPSLAGVFYRYLALILRDRLQKADRALFVKR